MSVTRSSPPHTPPVHQVSQRERDEVLTTRSWKERQAATSASPAYSQAVVRVRFPEGVCLQGNFGAAEPVSAIAEWVAASLRWPNTLFELVTPDRKPLRMQGCVREAKPSLLPATLLNFMARGEGGMVGAGKQQPYLNDELLRQAQMAPVNR